MISYPKYFEVINLLLIFQEWYEDFYYGLHQPNSIRVNSQLDELKVNEINTNGDITVYGWLVFYNVNRLDFRLTYIHHNNSFLFEVIELGKMPNGVTNTIVAINSIETINDLRKYLNNFIDVKE